MKSYTYGRIALIFILALVGVNSKLAAGLKHPTVQMFEGIMHLSEEEMFRTFVKVYNKNYVEGSSEWRLRFATFKQNIKEIKEHNQKADATYTLGVTEFADYTSEQIFGPTKQESNLKIESSSTRQQTTFKPINWAESGAFGENMFAINPSDWTTTKFKEFITIAAALEFSYYQQHNKAISFSPQALIDCYNYNNYLSLSNTFLYILGLPVYEASAYPYTGKLGTCTTPANATPYYFTGLKRRLNYDDQEVEDIMTLLQRGPLTFTSRLSYPTTYTGGIYPGKNEWGDFRPTLLVGYGIDPTGVEYWVLRGTYGKTWGEKGYMRVIRNDDLGNWGIQRTEWTKPIVGTEKIDNPYNK